MGGGPLYFSSPCSLVGPTPLLLSVGGAGRASVVGVILALAPRPGICPQLFPLFFSLVAPLVCAVWHNMVTYFPGSLLSLRIPWCDACLVAVVLPIQMSVGGQGSFLLVSSSGRSWCTPLLAWALAALPCPCACTCACSSPPWRGSLLACARHGSRNLFGYLCSLSFSRARRGMQHTCATRSLHVSCRVLRVSAPLFSLFKRVCGGGGFSSYPPRWAGLGSHLHCLALAFTHLFCVLCSLPFPCARRGM